MANRSVPSRRSDLPLSQEGAGVVSFTHKQNRICSQKQLNDIAHEHTIICRQLFAGLVVGSRPMKRKKHLHRMIIYILLMHKWNQAFLLFAMALAWKFPDRFASWKILLKNQTQWSNDKTIIELSYRKISGFVSVSQISSAWVNNWSARHWKMTIFCSTTSNNC